MNTATMTDNSTATAQPSKLAPRRRMGKRAKILLIILSLIMMGVFRTGFLFIIIALMPSIIMYYVDASRRRHTFKTIFACNLSGVVPSVGKMISFGPSSQIMQEIMGDAQNWFIIYGSALIGWMMVRTAPMIAHTLITGFHQTQVMRLGRNQRNIENEWGKEVTQFSIKEADADDDFFR